jgi:hypothetical protein
VKRFLLVILAAAAFAPATAHAATPCRDRIYNDWYADGKIGTKYSLACYRDALKHVPADARTYSSLADDIRSAMQAAQARQHGTTTVPEQVGKGGPPPTDTPGSQDSNTSSTSDSSDTSSDASDRNQPVNQSLPTVTNASARTDSGSSIPVPLLVLGALALILVAVGGAGLIAKRRRA